MANVKFLNVQSQATYDNLLTKEPNALYFVQETSRFYHGSRLMGTGALATAQAAGLLSPEDYASLQTLIAGGVGVNELVPVDGSIVVTKQDNVRKIGVGLSAVDGNMLTVKEDGLYVQAPQIAEYAIEKQDVPEDGFATSYKLKKTIDGVSEYVGDTINIAKDMVLQGATLEVVTEADVPYTGAVVGDPYIDMAFNDAGQSHIYIPVKGLVDTYTAGDGIEIVNGKISVKLASEANGLVAVDGALSINLATRKSNGAMSKEDKLIIESLPSAYQARKYDISGTPAGTLVKYRDDEIRIMCPADAVYTQQSVGTGGDANTYYITLKTYVPSDDVVGYMEHMGSQSDAKILTDIKTDEYGRRYQPTWLGVAKFDAATSTWTYYGKTSSEEKYIGWDYRIDWYDKDGVKIHSDATRINLSNEDCHNTIVPYYMGKYATTQQIEAIEERIDGMNDSFTWGEL